jgi:hypothetical protein
MGEVITDEISSLLCVIFIMSSPLGGLAAFGWLFSPHLFAIVGRVSSLIRVYIIVGGASALCSLFWPGSS